MPKVDAPCRGLRADGTSPLGTAIVVEVDVTRMRDFPGTIDIKPSNCGHFNRGVCTAGGFATGGQCHFYRMYHGNAVALHGLPENLRSAATDMRDNQPPLRRAG